MDDDHEVIESRVQDPAGVAYCVRAVKVGLSLRRRQEIGPGPQESATDVAATLLSEVVVPFVSAWRASRRDEWKVGVLRDGSVIGEKVVHKERLGAGVDPHLRIGEIVELIGSGRMHELGV